MDFAWIPRIHLLLVLGVLVALINTLNTQGRGSKSAGDRQESLQELNAMNIYACS
jgi:hypothetical protein